MKEITDPELLKQLNSNNPTSSAPSPGKEITDPELIQQLEENGVDPPLPEDEAAKTQAEYANMPFYQKIPTAVSDDARLLADGLTMGFSDKLQARLISALQGQDYDKALKYVRSLTKQAEDRSGWAGTAARFIGSLIGLKGLSNVGLTTRGLVSEAPGALNTLGRVGASTAEGTALGVGDALGHDTDIKTGAVTGAIGGAAGQMVGETVQSLLGSKLKIPTKDEIENAARQAYQETASKGVIFTPSGVDKLTKEIQGELADASFRKANEPKIAAFLKELKGMKGQNTTFEGLESLRRAARNISTDYSESSNSQRYMAYRILNTIDSFVHNAGPNDVLTGNAQEAFDVVRRARKLWAQKAKMERIEDFLFKTENRASKQGFEDAAQSQLQKMVEDPRLANMLTDEEKKLALHIVRPGFGMRRLQDLGKLSPSDSVQGARTLLGSSGIGGIIGATAGGGDPMAATAGAAIGTSLPILGMAAKTAADVTTMRKVAKLAQLVQSGTKAQRLAALRKATQTLSPEGRDLLSRMLTVSTVEGANTDNPSEQSVEGEPLPAMSLSTPPDLTTNPGPSNPSGPRPGFSTLFPFDTLGGAIAGRRGYAEGGLVRPGMRLSENVEDRRGEPPMFATEDMNNIINTRNQQIEAMLRSYEESLRHPRSPEEKRADEAFADRQSADAAAGFPDFHPSTEEERFRAGIGSLLNKRRRKLLSERTMDDAIQGYADGGEVRRRPFDDMTDPDSADYPYRHGGSLVTGIIDSLARAFTLPGRVYRGEVDLNDRDKAVEESLNAAGILTLGAGAAPKVLLNEGEHVLGSGPIRAYHGSPHDFDRFDLNEIGPGKHQGEGQMTEGFGHYFAKNKSHGETYRDMYKDKPNVFYKGMDLGVQELPGIKSEGESVFPGLSKSDQDTILYWMSQTGSAEEAAKWADRIKRSEQKYLKDRLSGKQVYTEFDTGKIIPFTEEDAASSQRIIDHYDHIAKFIRSNKDNFSFGNAKKGRLYEVELRIDPRTELINYDLPFNRSSLKVRTALTDLSKEMGRAELLDQDLQSVLMGDIHQALHEGGNRDVSHFLQRKGVPGSTRIEKEADSRLEGARYYTIWDDPRIHIIKKYAKGGIVNLMRHPC